MDLPWALAKESTANSKEELRPRIARGLGDDGVAGGLHELKELLLQRILYIWL